MSRTAFAFIAAALLLAPAAASAKDDCLSDSDWKWPAAQYTVRFTISINNKSTETLVADFIKTVSDSKTRQTIDGKVDIQFASKAMAPGQKASVTDKVSKGTVKKLKTKIAGYDSTYFSLENVKGGGRTIYYKGKFDSRITCNRRWDSAKHHWYINYVINPG